MLIEFLIRYNQSTKLIDEINELLSYMYKHEKYIKFIIVQLI